MVPILFFFIHMSIYWQNCGIYSCFVIFTNLILSLSLSFFLFFIISIFWLTESYWFESQFSNFLQWSSIHLPPIDHLTWPDLTCHNCRETSSQQWHQGLSFRVARQNGNWRSRWQGRVCDHRRKNCLFPFPTLPFNNLLLIIIILIYL